MGLTNAAVLRLPILSYKAYKFKITASEYQSRHELTEHDQKSQHNLAIDLEYIGS
jgi:hypothetical protein